MDGSQKSMKLLRRIIVGYVHQLKLDVKATNTSNSFCPCFLLCIYVVLITMIEKRIMTKNGNNPFVLKQPTSNLIIYSNFR